MARAPRPILKTTLSDPDQASSTCPLPFASCSYQLHVHFPPTPHLARMEITHSPNTYDRAPIVVVPNDCAIPDRGCRSYGDGDRKAQPKHRKRPECTAIPGTTPGTGIDRHQRLSMKYIESYFHPRAFEASSPCNNTGILDREEKESEDAIQSLFAPLPPSLAMTTTASWTPPLTRCSSPLLSSSSFASSSDHSSSLIPVPLCPQPQLHVVQQPKSSDVADNEETASTMAASSTASLNTLALTLLPYIPPSSSSTSSKSSKKKKGSVAAAVASSSSSAGENYSGRRRSKDLDCLAAYTRCSPFRDPALDGCLGGF